MRLIVSTASSGAIPVVDIRGESCCKNSSRNGQAVCLMPSDVAIMFAEAPVSRKPDGEAFGGPGRPLATERVSTMISNRVFLSGLAVFAASACIPVQLLAQSSDSGGARPARRARLAPVSRDYKVVEVTNGGTIEGVVLFKDKAPPPEKIAIVKDQETCKHHPPQRPLIKVNEQGRVAEVVVFVNLKEGKAPDKSSGGLQINQKSCEFEPHVQVLHVGVPFTILNSDPVLHNIQAVQDMRTVFNHVQAQKGMKKEEAFKEPGLVSVTCQAHPWMKAWVYVLPHPYHDVTGEDGAFKITDVPPGEYELRIWQEHLGEQSIKVKVESGQTSKVEYQLESKASRAK